MQLPGEWKAPSEDGEILIWPGPGEIQKNTLENQRLLGNAHGVRLGGIPLPEIRRWLRKWIDAPVDRPLIGAGHQVELSHPGVWAKNILIDELVKRVGGAAYQFSVDTDAPKHLVLRWPGGGRPITDDPKAATAEWAGLLDAPTPGHLQLIETELEKAAESWGFRPHALDFLHTLKRLTMEIPRLAPLLISALHEVDWGLGLRHSALAVAPLWESEGYLLCAHHLAARAGEFAADYNGVLHEYRREKGIHSPGRPWPDLVVSGDQCELPFWLDCLESGHRLRASVKLREGGAVLDCPKDEGFVFKREANGWEAAESLKKFLLAHRLRLSPRALALTMFLRLIVCDQFVHGIGGALYDEITDRVIRKRLGIDAPAFCVTTATLLFPAAVGQKRVELKPLLAAGRRMRHGALDGEKMTLVKQIEALPRRSPERSRVFYEMHTRLANEQRRPEFQAWEQKLEEARKRVVEEKDLFDRELFFAIQPEARLRELIQRYRAEFG
ncbi:MAG TPA: hypothetical protein VGQ99_11455 [Tepidisphaeraceae bacterium]|jgi:hypothetical protein|nr:hypothetical protein [Tepidisphaeraceae bacterium]